MAGILGGFDPKTLGLLMAGANMLQASGPSLQPRSLGQIMGTGLMGGLQGFGMGQQFQAMQEQADLRKAQADKIKADALREARLRSLLEGGDAPVPSPQPITEPSLGGPVTSFPVGLKTVESRPVDAPAPQGPNQAERMKQQGQRLISAGFLAEGNQLIQSANALQQQPSMNEFQQFNAILDAAGITDLPKRQEIFSKLLEKRTTHQPAVSVNNIIPKADSKYLEKRLEGEAEDIRKLYSSADTAAKNNQALDRILKNNQEAYAGAAAPILSNAANFLSSFGYDSKALTSTAAVQQAVGEMLASRMSELGARGLTDKDMEILRDNLPRVDQSKTARDLVVRVLKKANESVILDAQDRRRQELEQHPELRTRTRKYGWEDYRPAPEEPTPAPAEPKVIPFGDLRGR